MISFSHSSRNGRRSIRGLALDDDVGLDVTRVEEGLREGSKASIAFGIPLAIILLEDVQGHILVDVELSWFGGLVAIESSHSVEWRDVLEEVLSVVDDDLEGT